MDVALLSRLQFALAISFHYIFPPISLGLGLLLVVLQCLYLKTSQLLYHQMIRFWVPIFAIVFGFGAVTGFLLEQEIGTRWANYSHFIKPFFGDVLVLQALISFILEFSLIALLVFGWGRIRKFYYLLIIMGATLIPHFNAFWIVMMNSWQQDPQGFRLIGTGVGMQAEITNWWTILLNPSFLIRISHIYTAAWLTGSFLVIGLGAYYLLKKMHVVFAKASIKIGLAISIIGIFLHCLTGHFSALNVFHTQPAKLASIEGHFHSRGPADLYVLGWVDTTRQETWGLFIPGGLSFLTTGDPYKSVLGLDVIPENLQPPINFVFQTYHLMVMVGVTTLMLTVYSTWLCWRKRLFRNKKILCTLAFSTFLPMIGNQAGWYTAEVGRQPWLVYGLLQTPKGLTPLLEGNQLLGTISTNLILYLVLGSVFIYLLQQRVKFGPTLSLVCFKPLCASLKLVGRTKPKINRTLEKQLTGAD